MKMKQGSMEGILLRKPGQEGVILGSHDAEQQLERLGLNIGKYNIPGTNLIMIYHTGEILKIGHQTFLAWAALICHRKNKTISELNEDEVFEAVMELAEREVKVTADRESFFVYELC